MDLGEPLPRAVAQGDGGPVLLGAPGQSMDDAGITGKPWASSATSLIGWIGMDKLVAGGGANKGGTAQFLSQMARSSQ